MGLFKRKETAEPKSDQPKLDPLRNAARKKVLDKATQAISASYKQGRLIFVVPDDKIEYTDKEGNKEVMSYEDCAALFWSKMNSELVNSGATMSLVFLNVKPEDIKRIILGLR